MEQEAEAATKPQKVMKTTEEDPLEGEAGVSVALSLVAKISLPSMDDDEEEEEEADASEPQKMLTTTEEDPMEDDDTRQTGVPSPSRRFDHAGSVETIQLPAMKEEMSDSYVPQKVLTTTEGSLEDDDGSSVAPASGDVSLITALARSTSTLQAAPLRVMNHGLKELNEKTREVDRLAAALVEVEIKNDGLNALVKLYMEQLKHSHERVSEIEKELQGQHTVFQGAGTTLTNAHDQEQLTIRDIWDIDVTRAFKKLQRVLNSGESKFFAALDTEFCRKDGVVDPPCAPQSTEGHYEQAHRVVDGGDLVQVGIFLAGPNLEAACNEVFQFNLKFDSSSRSPDSKNVAYLRDTAKMNLQKHATDGVLLQTFISLLKSSGLLSNRNITWITFQCYSDFGYIIRALREEDALPIHRWQFTNLVHKYFPSSYDIKIFHELGLCCRKPTGEYGSRKLSAFASSLGVNRLGKEHGAASDAHITMQCFCKLTLSHSYASSDMLLHKGAMYGVLPSVRTQLMPTNYYDTSEILIWADSFERESKIFAACFNRHTVLAAEIRFLESRRDRWHSYATARKESANAGNVDVGIAVSSWSGNVAFGRLWIFHLQGSGSGQSNRINLGRMAETLAVCGAVLDSRTVWVSSSGACFLYLMTALTAAGCLPLDLQVFHNLCVAFFPNFRVLQVDSSEGNLCRRAFFTLQQFLTVYCQNPTLGWHFIHDLAE